MDEKSALIANRDLATSQDELASKQIVVAIDCLDDADYLDLLPCAQVSPHFLGHIRANAGIHDPLWAVHQEMVRKALAGWFLQP
jgi:hypothetical protein